MKINEITVKSLLRKHKKIDSWFITHQSMNLYRGCSHRCVYCDGQAEGYYVTEKFGEEVAVKINAPEILKKELDPHRKRTPIKKSYLNLGGGVSDSYQTLEEKYELCRKVLGVACDFGMPVSILTKSVLVKRDLDLIKQIHQQSGAIVSFSFSSMDDDLTSIFEPGASAASQRLEAIKYFKQNGIPSGIFLMPVIPFITDSPALLEKAARKAREAGADFIIFGGMTLKEGRQKENFRKTLFDYYPRLELEYQNLYTKDKYGLAKDEYYQSLNETFAVIAKKYNIPLRLPLKLFKNLLNENDLAIVILEHMDYYLKLSGNRSPYGYAAYSISQLKEPLSALKGQLRSIKGVGEQTERVIKEILNTKSSFYYERLCGIAGDRPRNLIYSENMQNL
ncbi:MAG: hypothetical protein A2252_05930 [Elusimicrobia bacterium RIFOXYA2_FULL_39_19]|nr:MAG: hypothetical protein A2252_05930 [Elusimicrobia bacterium RIFOXYA2_FULL_39_19]